MTSLNLGCGLDYRPGALNIDRYDLTAPDLQADALRLPLANASVAHIKARHLVEHLGHAGTIYALAEWFRVLEPGGTMLIETPDRLAACLAAAEPTPQAPALHWLFGLPWTGYTHRTLFDQDELRSLAEQARWTDVNCVQLDGSTQEGDGLPPSLLLTARKPLDPLAQLRAWLHIAFVEAGIVDPLTAPPHLAHLESTCDSIISAVGALPQLNTRGCLSKVLGATAKYTPRLTLAAISALLNQEYASEAEAEPFLSVARTLTDANFPARMAARLRQFPTLPGTQRKRIRRLHEETALYLTGLLNPGEDALVEAREQFETDGVKPSQSDTEIEFFCPETVARLCQRETAKGVRAFSQGQLSTARLHLEAAIAYDVDYPLPRWNLARLELCEGKRPKALESYAALLELLPNATALLRHELDTATDRGGANLAAFLRPVQLQGYSEVPAQMPRTKADK